MTKPQIAGEPVLSVDPETAVCEALTMGVVVFGMDFRSKRLERVYDADKVWSGEHTSWDYTEI